MEELKWQDGKFRSSVGISALNRAFLYGDGFFESFLCINGKPAQWELRTQRIARTMHYLSMNFVPGIDQLSPAIMDCVAPFADQVLRCRLTFYRAGGGRYLPMVNETEVVLQWEALDESPMGSVDVSVVDIANMRLTGGPDGNHKLIGKHQQVIASLEARDRKLDDLLLLNERDEVVECIASNVMARMDGAWITPPLESGCLNGIARAVMLERPDVREERINADQLKQAEMLCSVNSIQGVKAMQWKSIQASPDALVELQMYLRQRSW
jgi:branched-subunit amino acid aminotransferase/4-amino-4-deoxychorismate lyase